VDNEASKYALIRGYGKDANINSVIGMYWLLQATQGWSPWMERVSSSANISDGVSRDDFQMADRMGWHRIDVDLTKVYEILVKASDDMIFAHTEANDLISRCLQDQPHVNQVTSLLNSPYVAAASARSAPTAESFEGRRRSAADGVFSSPPDSTMGSENHTAENANDG